MAEKIIKTVIQVRRDTEANWLLHKDVIPVSGEPCLTLDGDNAGQVKYGDGVTTWENLPYSGAVALEGDGISTQVSNKVISILGAESATAGQMIRIGAEGKLEWYTPTTAETPEEIQNIVSALEAEVGALAEAVDDVYKKAESDARFEHIAYEFVEVPTGTVVDYREKEIRVMCPSDYEWTARSVGTNSDANTYYLSFRAYAPSDDVVSFQEALAETISDETMYNFDENDMAGVDEYGRKYSLVGIAAASYDEETDTWTYYGDTSTESDMYGFHYSVRWYDESGVLVASDHIRINLTNESCHYSLNSSVLENIAEAIGIATDDTVGLVKGSDEITVEEDGSLSVVAVPLEKVVVGDDDLWIMDGGNATA